MGLPLPNTVYRIYCLSVGSEGERGGKNDSKVFEERMKCQLLKTAKERACVCM